MTNSLLLAGSLAAAALLTTPAIVSAEDQCPTLAEDLDGFEDDDGCPDSDNDADGTPDMFDFCPNAPEVRDGLADWDGCPDNHVDNFAIDDALKFAVLFEPGSTELTQSGHGVVAYLADKWRHDPSWAGFIVRGWTSETGDENDNIYLSRQRARAVRLALVAHRVPDNLVAMVGAGEADADAVFARRADITVVLNDTDDVVHELPVAARIMEAR